MKSNLLKLTISSLICGSVISGSAQAQNFWPQPESAYQSTIQSPQWIDAKTQPAQTVAVQNVQRPAMPVMQTRVANYPPNNGYYMPANNAPSYPFPQTHIQPVQQNVAPSYAPQPQVQAAPPVMPPAYSYPNNMAAPQAFPQPYGYAPQAQYYPQPAPQQMPPAGYAPYGYAPYGPGYNQPNQAWNNGWPNGNVVPFGNWGNMDMGHWKMPSMNNGPWNNAPWGNNTNRNNNTPWNNWMPNMNDMSMPNFDMPSPSFSMPTMGMPGMGGMPGMPGMGMPGMGW
ncbi:hypothetical protein THMIRHAS_05750 [Thiosulfatimonas sediminis]|uniref:Uncharacterized protein n=1 Tax=Thiosulfatimonas sediminis TaxID=2675054 RepID=A0A6F8PST7_9GAMM|nr:hypothetical protein [Thiosulfatimonas sediminis]BBP45202.1 hypothetical protein THMIRHAS_05750 [Thiosulfatimonas sediminis]